jgi:hypothetical protein
MFVVRIIDDTLEEGRGDIFGSGEVLSEGSEGSGVANGSKDSEKNKWLLPKHIACISSELSSKVIVQEYQILNE